MISVQDVRKGMVLKLDGDFWTVMSMLHVSPGKGGAFVKIRARSQKSGNSKETNFRSGEKVEKIDVYEKDVSYLYNDGDYFVFMDDENYEQYSVPSDMCEEISRYVVLNGKAKVSIYENNVLLIAPPNFVKLKVIIAEPGVKGDTATKATKFVELETGFKIQVPLFINENDILKIDTRTGEYLERVKN